MAALHYPGGDNIQHVVRSGAEAAFAHDPKELLRGEGFVAFCTGIFVGIFVIDTIHRGHIHKDIGVNPFGKDGGDGISRLARVIPPMTTIFFDSANFFASEWLSATFG